MTDYTRRELLVRAGAGAVVLSGGASVLAACGGTTSGSGTNGGSGGAELRVGLQVDLDTLNPLTTVTVLETHWLVYDKLMTYDATLAPVLSLAQSRDVSSDGRTITFTLPKGAKFTDGQPLTSEDVKFTFELIHETQLGFSAPYMANLEGVDTPDSETAVCHYSDPPADDPAVMTAILPKHLWSGMSKEELQKFQNSKMIGSGPFKLKSWEREASYALERNTEYWGDQPGLSGVRWIVYKSPESQALGLREGQADVTSTLTPTIYEGLIGVSGVEEGEYEPLAFDYFGCNTWEDPKSKGNPLLKDRVIRQALSLSIDRDKLVELVMGGRAARGTTIIPPAMTEWHLEIPEAEQLNNDPARANAMLDAAGYTVRDDSGIRSTPDGEPLRFRFWADNTFDRNDKAGQLIVPMAREVGIALDPYVFLDDATMIERVFTTGDFDCILWNWSTPPNPTFMLSVESCDSFHVLSDAYYCNDEYEQIYQAQRVETDQAKRRALVEQAQKLFYDDCAYSVLYYPNTLEPHRADRLVGWQDIPNGVVFNFTTANYLALTPTN
jgi:peptide/nickel transport system substrate-binding protein